MLAVAANRVFAGGKHNGIVDAKIASLFEGGVEQSETEGVMRLRRMRSAETSLPTRCAAIRAAAKYRVAGTDVSVPYTHRQQPHADGDTQ